MISRRRRIRNYQEIIKGPPKIKTGGDPLKSFKIKKCVTSLKFPKNRENSIRSELFRMFREILIKDPRRIQKMWIFSSFFGTMNRADLFLNNYLKKMQILQFRQRQISAKRCTISYRCLISSDNITGSISG